MNHTSGVPSAIALLLILALVPGCQEMTVTAVDVEELTVTPSEHALFPGGTIQLSPVLRDRSGNSLPGRNVSWSSDNEAVARVDRDGLVESLAVGVTRIRAVSGGAEGHATIIVLRPPRILLEQTQVQFTGVSGAGPAQPRQVAVANAGDGTLEALELTVYHEAGSPTGWLEATLQNSRAPTTIHLRATALNVPSGRHRAEVRVSASGADNSPRVITVEFEVTEPPPDILLSSEGVAFSWQRNSPTPAPRTVLVTTEGGRALGGLEARIRYPSSGPTDWLNATLSSASAPSEVTVGVRPDGLSDGRYEAWVDVMSDEAGNSPRTVHVELTVTSPPSGIELDPPLIEWEMVEGSEPPPARTVAIRSVGITQLGGLNQTISFAAGGETGWLDAEISGSQTPTSMVLQVTRSDLPPGSHRADVLVFAPEALVSPRSVTVHLEVLEADPSDDGGDDESGGDDGGSGSGGGDGSGGDDGGSGGGGGDGSPGDGLLPLILVSGISYHTTGGADGKKHLKTTVTVVREPASPVSGATVTADLRLDAGQSWRLSGRTRSDGTVTFDVNDHPSGCYSTEIVAVELAGYSWDGLTPSNGYCTDDAASALEPIAT